VCPLTTNSCEQCYLCCTSKAIANARFSELEKSGKTSEDFCAKRSAALARGELRIVSNLEDKRLISPQVAEKFCDIKKDDQRPANENPCIKECRKSCEDKD